MPGHNLGASCEFRRHQQWYHASGAYRCLNQPSTVIEDIMNCHVVSAAALSIASEIVVHAVALLGGVEHGAPLTCAADVSLRRSMLCHMTQACSCRRKSGQMGQDATCDGTDNVRNGLVMERTM